VQAAALLMYISAGLEVIGGVLGAVGVLGVRDAPEPARWLVATLIGAGLWLWMAWATRSGRPWARTVGTVLFGVNTVMAPFAVLVDLGFLSAGSMQALLALAAFRWLLALAVVVLLWTPESGRYYRYADPGGFSGHSGAEPWTVMRRSCGTPEIPASVPDRDVAELRAFLRAAGPAQWPDNELAAAAFTEAVAMRFGRRATRADVAAYVAEVLRRPVAPGAPISPWAAVELILATLGSRPAAGIDPFVARVARGVLLRAIVSDARASDDEVGALLVAARKRADYALHAGYCQGP
jgi:hypothetical protein